MKCCSANNYLKKFTFLGAHVCFTNDNGRYFQACHVIRNIQCVMTYLPQSIWKRKCLR